MNRRLIRRAIAPAAMALAVVSTAPAALAAAGQAHGSAGQPGNASRTVQVEMHDNYYVPEEIAVKAGETVRFVVTNKGQLVHEFNLGTPSMHAAHQDEMQMMVEHGVLEADKINHDKMNMDMGGGHVMTHDDPNSVLLEPKQSGEVIWKFTVDAELQFALYKRHPTNVVRL